MPISLRAMLASSDGWPLGETRRITSSLAEIMIGDEGLAIQRNIERVLIASEYPDFYNLASGVNTAGNMLTVRTATGLAGVNGVGSDRTNTLVAAGPAGSLTRSLNGGSSFTAVTSGITANLGQPAFGNGVWVIPYATGKVLRSTDSAASWVDTTISGSVPNFSPLGRTLFANGTFIYAYQGYVYVSADGLSWTDISATARGAAGNVLGLSVGQGLHVLNCQNRPRYSADGGATWNNGTPRGITNPAGELLWTGKYWVSGGSLTFPLVPASDPPPTVFGCILSASETIDGSVSKLEREWTSLGSYRPVEGGNYWDPGKIGYPILAADRNSCIIGQYSSVLNGYAIAATWLYSQANIERLLSLTPGQPNPIRVTGHLPLGEYRTLEDGTIITLSGASNQFGMKGGNTVSEITLAAYTYSTNHVPNANWYTRIK